MATGGHLKKITIYNKNLNSDLNNVRTDCWPITLFIQTDMLGTREYTLCSPFRANAHNSSYLGNVVTETSQNA